MRNLRPTGGTPTVTSQARKNILAIDRSGRLSLAEQAEGTLLAVNFTDPTGGGVAAIAQSQFL
jgi:hypothetical protein